MTWRVGRSCFAGVACSIWLAALAPALAQEKSSDQLACEGDSKQYPLERQIAGCTALLQSETYISNNKARSVWYRDRGIAYVEKGDYDRAESDFADANRLNDKDYEALKGLALIELQKGDGRMAFAHFSVALDLMPTDGSLFALRARADDLLGEPERSISDLTEALRLSPDSSDYYYRRGAFYYRMKDFDRAVLDFRDSVRRDPRNAKALYARGLTETKLGRNAEGKADIARAVAIEPNIAASFAN